MSLLIVLPILVPLLGAGGAFWLCRSSHTRRVARAFALLAAGLTLLVALASRWFPSSVVVPSRWQPDALFGTVLAYQVTPGIQPLALVMALVTFSALLLACLRKEEAATTGAAALGMLAAGVASLWAANVATLTIGWAIYDIVRAIGRLRAGGSTRGTVQGLVLSSLATALLWGGALLSQGRALTQVWSTMGFSEAHLTLWTIAGVLRLALYPVHLSAPDEFSSRVPAAVSLFMGLLVGWGFWIRVVAVNGGAMPRLAWLPGVAAVSIVIGSFLSWTSENPRRALPWAGMSMAGATLLAAYVTGSAATAVILAGGVTWALAAGALSLGIGLGSQEAPWWRIPSWIGALALAGLPLTLGFVVQASLLEGVMRGGQMGWGSAFVLGQAFLIPSLARVAFLQPADTPIPRRWQDYLAYGVALGLPTLLLVVPALHPPAFFRGVDAPSFGWLLAAPGLGGWLLWIVALVVAGVLTWQERNLRSRVGFLLSAAHDLLRLDWLYATLAGAADRGLGVLRAADDLVGGAGALLWSLLLFLILLLIWMT